MPAAPATAPANLSLESDMAKEAQSYVRDKLDEANVPAVSPSATAYVKQMLAQAISKLAPGPVPGEDQSMSVTTKGSTTLSSQAGMHRGMSHGKTKHVQWLVKTEMTREKFRQARKNQAVRAFKAQRSRLLRNMRMQDGKEKAELDRLKRAIKWHMDNNEPQDLAVAVAAVEAAREL